MKRNQFPKCIIPIKNPDKTWHEPIDMDDLGNFSHPCRVILCGNPNSGKSLTILQLLLHKKPPFDKIYVIHNDTQTKEYDSIDCEILDELPDIDDLDSEKSNLIIIEDLEYKTMSREQRALLDRYFGCFSTHRSVSLFLTSQDAVSIPCTIRRMSSHVFLWRSGDVNHMSILSSRFGLTPRNLRFIFDNILTDRHDSLLIDSTRPECRFRKNIYEVINIKI